MKGVCPLLQMSPHVPHDSATTAATPRATLLPALAENRHYCVSNPGETQHQQGGGLKLAAVVLALDSVRQCKEEDCVPLPAPWPGLDAGRESCFPSFEAAWVFVFPCSRVLWGQGLVEAQS